MTIALWAALGLLVAAALNHLADRLPPHKSPFTRPACRSCGEPYRLRQWMAWLALSSGNGRCIACGARLPLRRLLLEAGVAALFGALAWRYPFSPALAMASFHGAVLALITVTDLEERRVPDAAIFPAMGLTLALDLLTAPSHVPYALLGAAIGLVPFLLCTLIHMGLGDVFLAAYVGLIAGFPRVLPCLLLAVLSGGAASLIMLVLGKVKRDTPIPYAPYLALGGLLAILYL